MALIKCPKCGEQISHLSAFCQYCGTPVEGSELWSGGKVPPAPRRNAQPDAAPADSGLKPDKGSIVLEFP